MDDQMGLATAPLAVAARERVAAEAVDLARRAVERLSAEHDAAVARLEGFARRGEFEALDLTWSLDPWVCDPAGGSQARATLGGLRFSASPRGVTFGLLVACRRGCGVEVFAGEVHGLLGIGYLVAPDRLADAQRRHDEVCAKFETQGVSMPAADLEVPATIDHALPAGPFGDALADALADTVGKLVDGRLRSAGLL